MAPEEGGSAPASTEVRRPPVGLTIAGSDSGGGAGVQADLATMTARGVFGTAAVTALTAQSTTGVDGVHPVPPEFVAEQIRSVTGDLPVGAVKTGMLGDTDLIRAVATELDGAEFPVVVDPVIVAESGDRLLPPDAEAALVESLLPVATLITPNLAELEVLTDRSVDTAEAAVDAARNLRGAGADAALVTGGHADWGESKGETVTDVLVAADEVEEFEHPHVPNAATHGSGCTLSAAVAAELAGGASLPAAVEAGTDHVHRAIRHGRRLGAGTGPVNHAAPLQARAGAPAALAAVRETVRTFEAADVSPLVPEVGTNVAVAAGAATTPADVAGIEGRLSRVPGGVRATGGAAMGASSHVARFLLAAREYDSSLTAACNVVGRDPVVAAITDRWPTVVVDRGEEPDDAAGTMDWAAQVACERRGGEPPVAVTDEGAHGKEPMCRLLAPSAPVLRERVLTVASAVDPDETVT